MTNSLNECVVGIVTLKGQLVKAFDIRIVGEDVYVNYSDCSTPEAHSSYHASGQLHTKKSKRYIEWDGGLSGHMEPMKLMRTPPGLVTGRSGCWTVGWEIHKLDQVLPLLTGPADMVVDAKTLNGELVLGLEVSVIGDEAKTRESIVGYPIIASHRFGESLRVEVDAFLLEEDVSEEEELPR
jgi:hypothetical protein